MDREVLSLRVCACRSRALASSRESVRCTATSGFFAISLWWITESARLSRLPFRKSRYISRVGTRMSSSWLSRRASVGSTRSAASLASGRLPRSSS